MDLKPLPSAKPRTTPAASLPSIGPERLATTTCELSPAQGLLPMELPSMSSAAGSRARTSASLENGLALKVRDLVSGRNMPVSLASYDPDSSSWKTSQGCFLSGLEPFSETWPRSGTMRRGIAYQLPPSAPLTDETESGSWPTPRACSAMAANFTENTALAKFPNLETMVARRMWPTPNATDGNKWSNQSLADRISKKQQVRLSTAVSPEGGKGGHLNPMWVEWLMGFPLGWTDLKD